MTLLNPFRIARRRSSRRFGSLLLLPLVTLVAAGALPDSFAAERETALQQTSASPDHEAKSRLLRIGTMSPDQRNEVQALITHAVRDRLQAAQRNGNATSIRTVHAYINQADDMLTIDIKRNEIPARSETIPADILDAVDELAKSIIYLLDPDLYITGYAVTIDGRPASEVMPDLPNPLREKSSRSTTEAAAADGPLVVVLTGHGYR